MQSEKLSILDMVRPHFRDMDGYVSAGMEMQKSADKIFLNANENPYDLPGLEGYNRYPEPQPQKLVEAMAAFYGVGNDNLLITRGADEGIALITRLFIEPFQDSILINPPTFGVYKVYAGAAPQANLCEVPLKKQSGSFALDTAQIRQKLDNDSSIKLVYLTNPNNPSGNLFDEADILSIIEAAKDKAVVVLDETYAEFTPEKSLVKRLKDFPHLIILRTLSKSFSMAGMRVGAILSGVPELIGTFKTKIMEVYPVPVGSLEAALRVFSPDVMKAAQGNIQKLIAERKRMETFWRGQSAVTHVYPSDANFLLIEMQRASEFANFCARNNVILRDFSKYPLTPDTLRISIGTPEQNDLVIDLFHKFYV